MDDSTRNPVVVRPRSSCVTTRSRSPVRLESPMKLYKPNSKHPSRSIYRLSKVSGDKLIRINPIALLCSLNLDLETESLGIPIATLLQGRPESLRACMYCLRSEIGAIENPTLILRGSGTKIRVITNLIKLVGKNYFQDVTTEIITDCISPNLSYEIDPAYLPPQSPDLLNENLNNVKETVLSILPRIKNSLHKIPPFIVVIIRELYNQVRLKFPGHENASVIGFFMLRFLMPPLAMPEFPGILPEVKKASTSISKILQFIYNKADPSKDSILQPLREFIIALHVASDELVNEFLPISDSVNISKLLSGTCKVKKKSQQSINATLLEGNKQLQDLLLQISAGKFEDEIEFMFEAVRKEHELLNKAFEFSRQFWIEHYATWLVVQIDQGNCKFTEQFNFTLEILYSGEPCILYKDFSFCEIVVINAQTGEADRTRLGRHLFNYYKVISIAKGSCKQIGVNTEATFTYAKDGKFKTFNRENWKEFEAGFVLSSGVGYTYGTYDLVAIASPSTTPTGACKN